MARLGTPVTPPDFGLDWEAEIEWANTEVARKYDGRVIRFPVADGYAEYAVGGDGLTLHHIETLDCYAAHPALIRGLNKSEIADHLSREQRLQEIFGG